MNASYVFNVNMETASISNK